MALPARLITTLQVLHRSILQYHEESNAHEHYTFFRSLLAGKHETDLNGWLEHLLAFLAEVQAPHAAHPVIATIPLVEHARKQYGSITSCATPTLCQLCAPRQVNSTPVLLSMLVVTFKHGRSGALPTSRYELYEHTISLAVRHLKRSELVFNLLQGLALANQFARRREFTSEHVKAEQVTLAALESYPVSTIHHIERYSRAPFQYSAHEQALIISI